MKYFDQHVHTHYSVDSNESIENYILQARRLGVDTLVFTDHLDLDSEHIEKWNFDLDVQRNECKKLEEINPDIHIYSGIEIGYVPEKKDFINIYVKTHKFNVVNLSLHVIDDIDLYFYSEFEKYGIDYLLNLYFDRMIQMISVMDDFDVLSHFDYAYKTVKKEIPSLQISAYENKITEIMKLLIKKERALEINMKVQNGINDLEHLRYVLRLYKSLGGKLITLSSDAHRSEKLFNNFKVVLPIFLECGFEELTCYINREKFFVKI